MGTSEGGLDRPGQNHLLKSNSARITVNEGDIATLEGYKHIVASYDTGWIARTDWTNVHMGTNPALNVDSNVTHSLDADLPDLIVKVLISAPGTDAASFEIPNMQYDPNNPGATFGFNVYNIDADNVQVQTGATGILYIDAAGATAVLGNWSYEIVVWKVA